MFDWQMSHPSCGYNSCFHTHVFHFPIWVVAANTLTHDVFVAADDPYYSRSCALAVGCFKDVLVSFLGPKMISFDEHMLWVSPVSIRIMSLNWFHSYFEDSLSHLQMEKPERMKEYGDFECLALGGCCRIYYNYGQSPFL